jgi:hypothetical protein
MITKTGRERQVKSAMESRVIVPAVTNKTLAESNGESRDREDGLVTKNSHSIAA